VPLLRNTLIRLGSEGSLPLFLAVSKGTTIKALLILIVTTPFVLPALTSQEIPRWTITPSLTLGGLNSFGVGLLASASLPAGLEVLEIGSDHILGIRRNELNVASVVKYEIS